MLRFAVLFFILAIIAAVLGFGGFAGAFASLAVISFYVFCVLLVLSLIAGLFFGGEHGNPGGAFGALVVAGLIGAFVYYWVDNGLTAQEVGAAIDQRFASATEEVGEVASTAGDEVQGFAERVDNAAEEAADGDGN